MFYAGSTTNAKISYFGPKLDLDLSCFGYNRVKGLNRENVLKNKSQFYRRFDKLTPHIIEQILSTEKLGIYPQLQTLIHKAYKARLELPSGKTEAQIDNKKAGTIYDNLTLDQLKQISSKEADNLIKAFSKVEDFVFASKKPGTNSPDFDLILFWCNQVNYGYKLITGQKLYNNINQEENKGRP